MNPPKFNPKMYEGEEGMQGQNDFFQIAQRFMFFSDDTIFLGVANPSEFLGGCAASVKMNGRNKCFSFLTRR